MPTRAPRGRLSPGIWVIAACAIVSVVATAKAAMWALTGNLGAHDPTLIKEGSTWWCFTTGTGLRVKSSPDGLQWTQGVSLFSAELPWWRTYAPQMGNLDVWAPDIHRFANRYWCYYSVSEFGRNNSAIGLTSCSSIATGDWRDDGLVISSRSGVDAFNAIDPSLTVDADGAPWLVFGSWFDGIRVVKLDAVTMKPTGASVPIARKPNGIEGPNIVHANGYYYLFVSVDVCCQGVNSTYKIAYGRATTITGPYLDKSNVDMLNGGRTVLEEGGTRWKGPGGQDVSEENGAWVIARHAYDAQANGTPTLLISDLYWDADKWPSFTAPAVVVPDPDIPKINVNPVSQTLAPGSATSLSVSASGLALTYEWTKNGSVVPGATSATLSLANLQTSDSGNYSVTVRNSSGQAVSRVATLLVATPNPGRLINLSVRSRSGSGAQTLIMGFVVSGVATRHVLVRGLGPKLAELSVPGALVDPKLTVFNAVGAQVDANDDWQPAIAATAQRLGATALTDGSKDAGLLLTISPGAYSAHVTAADGAPGIALVEAYDADADQLTRLVNVSARSVAGAGDDVLIAGFVLSGNVPKKLLIRGMGPSLTQYGVAGALEDPILRVFDQNGSKLDENDNWGGDSTLKAAFEQVGAARFASDTSKDAAILLTSVPGVYSVHVLGANNSSGVALVEIYEVP